MSATATQWQATDNTSQCARAAGRSKALAWVAGAEAGPIGLGRSGHCPDRFRLCHHPLPHVACYFVGAACQALLTTDVAAHAALLTLEMPKLLGGPLGDAMAIAGLYTRWLLVYAVTVFVASHLP